jgi:hypothetical protein
MKNGKNLVFIINCRKDGLSWLSDFGLGFGIGSVEFENYDNS